MADCSNLDDKIYSLPKNMSSGDYKYSKVVSKIPLFLNPQVICFVSAA